MSCLAQHPSHPIPCCLSLLCGLEHVPALLSASWCITRGFPSLSWLIPHPVTDSFLLRRVFIPASKRITFTSTLVKLRISVFENHFAKHFAFLSIQSDKYFVSTNLVPGIFTRSLCRWGAENGTEVPHGSWQTGDCAQPRTTGGASTSVF